MSLAEAMETIGTKKLLLDKVLTHKSKRSNKLDSEHSFFDTNIRVTTKCNGLIA